MTGIVTAVVRRREGQNGGYGFIRDAQNQERFFHARNLLNTRFEDLQEGLTVEFDPVSEGSKGNGMRAHNVEVTG
jgi:cold shock CspA family protein